MIRHSARRGVTLVEVVAITAALGVTVSGVTLLAHAKSNNQREQVALHSADRIASAAADWQRSGEVGCPTISVLQREQRLDRAASVDDAWGSRFRIVCGSGSMAVTSAGPDRAEGTRDDLHVPVD